MSPSGWVSDFVTVCVESSNSVTETLAVTAGVTAASLFQTVLVVILVVVVTVVTSTLFKSFSSQNDGARVGSPVSSV